MMTTIRIQSALRAGLVAMTAIVVAAAARPAAAASEAGLATAVFGSGCYWCTESDFDKVEGVVATTSGFMGGSTKNPTYEQVGSGGTGHVEVVEVRFDPKKVSYERLLEHYWRHVDFQDGGGQFCDRGDSYRPVIFTRDASQQSAAEASKADIARLFPEKPVAVGIEAAGQFYPGPDYHQDYYKKSPLKYQYYRWGCGRDQRIEALWASRKGAS